MVNVIRNRLEDVFWLNWLFKQIGGAVLVEVGFFSLETVEWNFLVKVCSKDDNGTFLVEVAFLNTFQLVASVVPNKSVALFWFEAVGLVPN